MTWMALSLKLIGTVFFNQLSLCFIFWLFLFLVTIIKYENFHQEFLNFYCITRATPFLRDNWSFKLPGKVLSKFINKKLSSLSTKLLHYLASTYNRIKNENFDQAFLNFYCIKRASPFLKENCRNFRKSFN